MSDEQSETIGSIGASSSTDFNSVHDSAPVSAPDKIPPTPRPRTATDPAKPVATSTSSEAKQPTAQAIQTAVAQANANLANYGRALDYQVDPATGITVATIRDQKTGAVLQQMPGTDMLHLAKLLAEWSPGKNLQLDLLA